jgi:hypothetical protein
MESTTGPHLKTLGVYLLHPPLTLLANNIVAMQLLLAEVTCFF